MSESIRTSKENDQFTIKFGDKIDTSNVTAIQAEALDAIKDLDADTHLVLDFNDLEYISSAGLRMVMLLNRSHSNMELANVGIVPYEVFDVTGLTQVLPIGRKKREIDISNLEKIGAGQTGSTYRLDEETIVKVFHEGVNPKLIEDERETAQKAFIAGVPTAIPFDTVKVGNRLGIVYELIPSSTFLGKIVNNKENLEESAKEYGKFLREANSIEVNTEDWINQKEEMLKLCEELKPYITPEEFEKVKEMIQVIPEGTTFVHGDAHPDNVLVLDDELLFIDMSTMGYGHPIFDLISFAGGVISRGDFSEEIPDDQFDERTQMTWGERKKVWRGMLKGYFNTEDEEFLDRVEKQVVGRTALRNALMIVHLFSGSDRFKSYLNNVSPKVKYAIETYENLDEPVFF